MHELIPIDLPGGGLFAVVFGLALLLAGRRIFWLVVGVIGFLFAYDLANRYLSASSNDLRVLVGLLAGILGVFLAIFLQKVAVGLAGFLIGGYLVLELVGGNLHPGNVTATELLAFFIGGAVCAVLALWLFETALILLSSLAGAALVTETIGLEPARWFLAFFILMVLGVAVQTGIGPRRRRRRYRNED